MREGLGDGRSRDDSDERDHRQIKRSRSRSRSPYRDRRRMSRERRDSTAHNEKMVYISNIPYDVRWMEIKDLVREKAGEVNFVEILEDRNGKSKGAAVVEFREKESVAKCIEALHRFQMKDRLVVAKEIRDPVAFFRKVKEDTGVDFLAANGGLATRTSLAAIGGVGRPLPPDRQPAVGTYETFGLSPMFLNQLGIEGPLCNRVFVANLAYNIQSGKIYDVFSLAGKLTWLDLQLDKEGKSKGLAVVQYSHPIEAVQAISMLNNQRLHDRTITVKMDKYEKTVDKRPGELPSGLRGVGMGLGANGAPLTDIASVLSTVNTQPATSALNTVGALSNSNFGGNSFNSGGGGSISQIPYASYSSSTSGGIISPQHSGGYGQVGGGGTSQSTLGYGGGGVGGGGGNSSLYGGGQTIGYGGGDLGRGGYGSYSAPVVGRGGDYIDRNNSMSQQNNSAPFMKSEYDSVRNISSLNQSPTPTRSIIIKNLPSDYTWQIVRDRTRQYGEVDYADMVSSGCAKVRYKHLADAERARGALQGTTVEGRIITVEFLFD